MKYFVVIVCLAQIAFGAPAEKTVAEQAQEAFANVQKQATEAVNTFGTKVREAAGVTTNEQLIESLQTRAATYATQIKGVADQISTTANQNKGQFDVIAQNVAKQLTESAAKLLGNDDPAKVENLQKTFGNVLESANSLNTRLGEEGTNIQNLFQNALSQLYDSTLSTAKNLAKQVDESQKN